jgi:hypothetical protein
MWKWHVFRVRGFPEQSMVLIVSLSLWYTSHSRRCTLLSLTSSSLSSFCC